MPFLNIELPKPFTSEVNYSYLVKAKTGDPDAKNEFIKHNLRLVASIVSRYFKNFEDYDIEELFQVGVLGLMKAIDNFDIIKSNVFNSSYAFPFIYYEIRRYLDKSSKMLNISRSIERLSYKILKFENEYYMQYGIMPTPEITIEKFKISKDDFIMAKNSINGTISIYQTVPDSEDLYLIDMIQIEELIDTLNMKIDIEAVLSNLSPLHKKIYYYYFIKDLTQKEVGEIVGSSQAEISRIWKEILRQIKRGIRVDENNAIKSNPKIV